MTLPSPPTPFSHEPIDEIPLRWAPLVRVLAQLRFESLGVFVKQDPLTPFVAALVARYPLFKEAYETEIVVGPAGVTQQPSKTKVWQLRTADSNWIITVNNGSLALETKAYDSRTSFVNNFKEVLRAFNDTVGTPVPNRLGIRYTNQIAVDTVGDAAMLIRSEAQGGLAIPLSDGVQSRHSINDSLFRIDVDELQVRWGLLPAGTVFDPSLPVMASQSLFLDLDSFTSQSLDPDVDAVGDRVRGLGERAYRIFRWMVTDNFLERFREAT